MTGVLFVARCLSCLVCCGVWFVCRLLVVGCGCLVSWQLDVGCWLFVAGLGVDG